MNLTNILVGLVLITVIFIAINLAVPQVGKKYYINQTDINQMQELGQKYVNEAKPSGLSSIFLYFSSSLAAIKTAFSMITFGLPNMINDVFTMMGLPSEISYIIIGLITFVIALYVLSYISGKIKKV